MPAGPIKKVVIVDGDKVEELTLKVLEVVGTYGAKYGLKPPEAVLALATAAAKVIEYAEKPAPERTAA